MPLKERLVNGAIFFLIILIIIGYFLHYRRWKKWNKFVSEQSVIDSTLTIYKKEILININTATVADLQRIPGVGPKTAENIIKCRDSIGEFTKENDLLFVKGIGEKKLNKIRRYINVE